VSEDHRVSRNSREPPKTGPGGAERWADYVDWVRADLIDGVVGLSDEEQRTARVPSGWTPVELLSHVLHMEQRWFVWGFLGEQVAEPWGDWDIADAAAQDRRWRVSPGVTADDLAGAGVDLLPRAVGVRPPRRSPRHRGRAGIRLTG
jgi:hypothetical protein